ncbi:PASTA domain-containing protein [Demequina sp. NBRC 110057]|uniref:PASTA domain-containing protein n=1 Tax=Demequina sp. NBRC 110057 TaxID=1570346 RepID=UPI00135646B3|nr:PASTA domain-containing protein [Demequina sp. NBRC 110057]
MKLGSAISGLAVLVVLAGCGAADVAAPEGSPTPVAMLTAVTGSTPAPDLIGLSLDEAVDAMEAATGTRPQIMMESDGVVISQSPEPGEPLPAEGAMSIEFSR